MPVLTRCCVLFAPVTERVSIRHEVQVRLPERVISFLPLIEHEDEERQLLLPRCCILDLLFLNKDVLIFFYDFSYHRVIDGFIDRYEATERHFAEGLSVLDWRQGSHTD